MKFTLDRIDEGIAVLISREDEPVRMTIPVSLLPPGVKEGDIVTLLIERDDEATAAARIGVTGLLDKLKKKQ